MRERVLRPRQHAHKHSPGSARMQAFPDATTLRATSGIAWAYSPGTFTRTTHAAAS